MGRYINCKIGDEYEIVWKCGLGAKNPGMHRISTELGIGEYHLIRYTDAESEEEGDEGFKYEYVSEDQTGVDGDVLILSRSDVEKLEIQIQSLRASNANEWFIAMTEAIRDFMVEHLEQDRFVFEGENP